MKGESPDASECVPLLVIVGPTAVGKTAVAIEVARRLGGEIVSADSMQIYLGLDVGTAKPTAEERRRARFHLIDCADPAQPYSVQQYQRDAEAAIADIHARGKLPILCGGTGLYVSAVVDHYVFPPGGEDSGLRESLQAEAERLGPEALHQRLAQVDPAAAAKIHPHNVKRVIRALEAYSVSGRPISELQAVDAAPRLRYNDRPFGLTMPRELLYARIEQRFARMVEEGLVAEVERLLAQGLSPECQALQALGYRHLAAALRGRGTVAEALRLAERDTRRYAKRQYTWFRRDQRVQWVDVHKLGGLEAVGRWICDGYLHPPAA
ncbi:MAG: tRNA (adenosine(37)-N6)-dimethylallyltransferase MiaA [Armatimonadota bacterium]